MAEGNFGPQIKAAIGNSPRGRLNKSPRKESPGSPSKVKVQTEKEPNVQEQQGKMPPNMQRQPMQAAAGVQTRGAPPDAHHVAAATSIAHAILGRRGGG